MKRKILSCIALTALCTPMAVCVPSLIPKNKHNSIVHPSIKYELQIGEDKYDVTHERDGFTTVDGAIINTDGHGYFATVKES